MSDQSDDNSRDHSQDHVEGSSQEPATSVSSELVAGSKDITLQRLSAHSSWEGAFGGAKRVHDEPFDHRLLRGEAKPLPGPDTARSALPWFATIVIAAAVGALSGAAATFGVTHFATSDHATATITGRDRSIDDAMARFSADLAAVKTNIETTTKTNTARIVKLSETLDKLKPAPEITGSITPPLPAAALPAPAPMVPQLSRLPILEGWVLREVGDGGATVEGRQGIFEVFTGDPLPGVGRVDAIRRQDGRWVVVTSRGLIVAR
ncbi:MAG: hypothetical protein K2X60_06120 [Xanthobacteraceae bacterium]|nr:hypothetical protein [Xanthobacteraceae bacterium]